MILLNECPQCLQLYSTDGISFSPGKGPGNFHFAAVEKFEKPKGVFTFLISCLFKDIDNLDKTFLRGTASEMGIPISGL